MTDIKVGADFNDALTEMIKFMETANALNIDLTKLAKGMIDFSEDGKAVIGTFKGMSDSGEKWMLQLRKDLESGVIDIKKFKEESISTAERLRLANEQQIKDLDKINAAREKNARDFEKFTAQQERLHEQEVRASQRAAEQQAKDIAKINEARRTVNAVDSNQVQGAVSLFGGIKGRTNDNELLRIQSALNSLTTAAVKAKITNAEFEALAKNVASGAHSFAAMTPEAAKVEVALRRLNLAIHEADGTGTRFGSTLLSWGSIWRLAQVQLWHVILREVAEIMKQAANSAAEFAVKISQVQSISHDARFNTESWQRSLVQLSNSYGFSAIETAGAAYETLSNQIGDGARATQFLDKALQFARVGIATPVQAINTLSSAINAYHLQAEDASRVSAILFKGIELGRFKAEDLGSTFGNVAPLAAQLGISLEEVTAALATITIQGVKADTAQTLLLNFLNKLLKPSKDMVKLFNDWGVASGQAAIQTFGFQGVLERLGKVIQEGGLGELAKDLNQIRALRFGSAVIGDLENYNENLKKISASTQDYERATKIVLENVGQLYTERWNKIKNSFMETVGVGLVHATVDLFGLIEGNVQSLSEQIALSVKLQADGAIQARDKQIQIVEETQKAKDQAFNQFFANIRAAAAKELKLYDDNLDDALKHAKKFVQDTIKLQDDMTRHAGERRFNLSIVENDNQLDVIDKTAERIKDLFNIADGLRTTVPKTWEDFAENIRNARDDFKEIEKLSQHVTDQVERQHKSIEKEILDLQKKQDEKKFEQTLGGLTPQGQIAAITEKIGALLKQEKQFASTGRRDLVDKTAQEIDDLIRRVASLDKSQLKGTGLTGIQAAGLSDKALEEHIRNLRDVDAVTKAELFKKIKEEQIQTDIKQRNIEDQKRVELEGKQKLAEMAQQLIQANDEIGKFKKALEDSKTNLAQGVTFAKTAQQEITNLTTSGSEFKLTKQLGVGDDLKQLIAGFKSVREFLSETGDVQLKSLRDEDLKKLASDFKEKTDALAEIILKNPNLQGVPQNTEFVNNLQLQQKAFSNAINQIINSRKGDTDAQKALADANAKATDLTNTLKAKGFDLNNPVQNISSILPTINQALRDLILQLQKTPPPVALAKADGGLINGPGGTDNILAGLTSGEFVMNKNATAQFLPQLMAMNFGRVPHYAEGGQVTNVGDINVNVHGGANSEVTGREIAFALRRELRRGSLTFGRR